jgi:hypothetical protein
MGTRTPGYVLIVGLMAAGLLNACYQAKTPDQVAKDTAAAENTATENAAKVEQNADQKLHSAQTVVHDEQTAATHTRAIEDEKVADAKAAGIHKISLAQCESLSGEAQKACRTQADTAYQTATAQAQQDRAYTDPKP